MARLHEYQGKALLHRHGIAIPRSKYVESPEQAEEAARELLESGAKVVVLKIQAWTTGRAAIGGVTFSDTPEGAKEHAMRLLAMTVGNFPVTGVLVEEKVDVRDELFVSLTLDDRSRRPVILLSLDGGTGIEERAGEVHRFECDVAHGPDEDRLKRTLADAPNLSDREREDVLHAVLRVFETARECEARSVEVNPLVITGDSRVIAADCRMTIDDYAIFRHPDLNIDIARELDHPPTLLERAAYRVEQEDHRGTFYFAQLATQPAQGSKGLIGFHGAGGGGSMMSMDAITAEGFTIANFTDTSGNPSAAKVYRAARIILSQPGIIGYFGSGSGVASQEQFWSAYGLAKAFWEMELPIPAVIRLGGNSEHRAVEILQSACAELPGRVEGYTKDDTPKFIAARFAELVEEDALRGGPRPVPSQRRVPAFVGAPTSESIPIKGGVVWVDATQWNEQTAALVDKYSLGLIRDVDGRPRVAPSEDYADKDSEFLACEVECLRAGHPIVFVDLPVPHLDDGATENTEEHAG